MQYSNRSSYENQNERFFYSSRQYDDNSKYKNLRYENPRYENSKGFDKMFITRAPQKVYYNKYSNKNMSYNIEEYYENFDFQYFTDFFSYHINNNKQFHDVYKNKFSKNENKTKFKNDVNVGFVVVFYYVIINKMSEKLIYYKCYKKFAFNNLLYTYLKSKSYRKKIIRSEKLSKNKKILYDSTLTKKSSIIKKLKLIKSITFFTFSNEMSFRFWYYLIELFSFFKNILFKSECLNTKCFMSINNKLFLKWLISFLIIKKHESIITLRKVDFNRYFINK